MMRNIILNILIIGMLLLSSCQIDNYNAPQMTLKGKIIDVTTGDNIQTRQPNGIQIRLLDQAFKEPVPYNFWAKNDGSFNNTRVPSSKYKVFPINGPFEQSSVEEKSIDLSHNQDITFEVEPYVRLTDVNIEKSGSDGIKATYRISPNKNNRKILKSSLIAYTSPILHQSTTNKLSSDENDLTNISNKDITTMTFVDEIKNLKIENLKKGEAYFARIEILTNNSLKRYNYSPIIKIEF